MEIQYSVQSQTCMVNNEQAQSHIISRIQSLYWALEYNEFDFFLENEEYKPFDGCKIEI